MNDNGPSEEVRKQYGHKLRRAAEEGHVRHVQVLLRKGADVNYVIPITPGYTIMSANDTPLHTAAEQGHMAVVEILIAAGANLNQRTVNSHSRRVEFSAPIHVASGNGYEDILKALLLAGADVDIEHGISRDTALQIAAGKGQKGVLDVLLEAGAQVNHQSGSGTTALHDAVRAGHEDTVKALMTAGGDPSIRNKRQETAFEAAKDFLKCRGRILTPSMMELLGEYDA